jgi:hypothetical protein
LPQELPRFGEHIPIPSEQDVGEQSDAGESIHAKVACGRLFLEMRDPSNGRHPKMIRVDRENCRVSDFRAEPSKASAALPAFQRALTLACFGCGHSKLNERLNSLM